MTKLIAHRGYSAKFPENSLESLLAAEKFGADGVEFDVRSCKTGELFVLHDENLARTHNINKNIKDLSADELVKHGLPSLKNIFEILSVAQKLFIEIKDPSDFSKLPNELAYAKAKGWSLDNIYIISFHSEALARFKAANPAIKIGFNIDNTGWIPAYAGMTALGGNIVIPAEAGILANHYKIPAFAGMTGGEVGMTGGEKIELLNINIDILDTKKLAEARLIANKIYIWTANDPKKTKQALDFKIDGIMTDEVEKIKAVIENYV